MAVIVRFVSYVLTALLLFFLAVAVGSVLWIASIGRFEAEMLFLCLYVFAPSLALVPAQFHYHFAKPSQQLPAKRLSLIGQGLSVATMVFVLLVVFLGAEPEYQVLAGLAASSFYSACIGLSWHFLQLPTKGTQAYV